MAISSGTGRDLFDCQPLTQQEACSLTATASPPAPLVLLGCCPAACHAAPTGMGQTEKVVTLWGRVCSRPCRAGRVARCTS